MKDQFSLAITKELRVPQRAVIGEVTPLDKSFRCEILLHDALTSKYEKRDIFLSLLPLHPLELPQYKLIMTESFLRRLQKDQPEAFFTLYHEIAYMLHRDLLNGDGLAHRFDLAAKGKVSAAVAEADAFAAAKVGVGHALKALKLLRKEEEAELRTAPKEKAKLYRQALQEIDGRIKILKGDRTIIEREEP